MLGAANGSLAATILPFSGACAAGIGIAPHIRQQQIAREAGLEPLADLLLDIGGVALKLLLLRRELALNLLLTLLERADAALKRGVGVAIGGLKRGLERGLFGLQRLQLLARQRFELGLLRLKLRRGRTAGGAFAQDAAGEVYALPSVTTGPNGGLDKIYKIVPAQ